MPVTELTKASLIIRLATIGAVIIVIAGSFAFAGGWLTPHALTPASMINTFEQVNGPHPGFRRNHAKGVCVRGYFESPLASEGFATGGRIAWECFLL